MNEIGNLTYLGEELLYLGENITFGGSEEEPCGWTLSVDDTDCADVRRRLYLLGYI